MVICGKPTLTGYRIWASSDPNPTGLDIQYDQGDGYNAHLSSVMHNMMVIDAVDFRSCLARLGEIWANQEAAAKEEKEKRKHGIAQ